MKYDSIIYKKGGVWIELSKKDFFSYHLLCNAYGYDDLKRRNGGV